MPIRRSIGLRRGHSKILSSNNDRQFHEAVAENHFILEEEVAAAS
jgi:hypothetical protein